MSWEFEAQIKRLEDLTNSLQVGLRSKVCDACRKKDTDMILRCCRKAICTKCLLKGKSQCSFCSQSIFPEAFLVVENSDKPVSMIMHLLKRQEFDAMQDPFCLICRQLSPKYSEHHLHPIAPATSVKTGVMPILRSAGGRMLSVMDARQEEQKERLWKGVSAWDSISSWALFMQAYAAREKAKLLNICHEPMVPELTILRHSVERSLTLQEATSEDVSQLIRSLKEMALMIQQPVVDYIGAIPRPRPITRTVLVVNPTATWRTPVIKYGGISLFIRFEKEAYYVHVLKMERTAPMLMEMQVNNVSVGIALQNDLKAGTIIKWPIPTVAVIEEFTFSMAYLWHSDFLPSQAFSVLSPLESLEIAEPPQWDEPAGPSFEEPFLQLPGLFHHGSLYKADEDPVECIEALMHLTQRSK